jgi:hypothetical protein
MPNTDLPAPPPARNPADRRAHADGWRSGAAGDPAASDAGESWAQGWHEGAAYRAAVLARHGARR